MEDEEEISPEEVEKSIVEFTTREEYIGCCHNALTAVDSFNSMTAADTARVRRIQRKCLRILDELVGEMYDELIDKENDEDEN